MNPLHRNKRGVTHLPTMKDIAHRLGLHQSTVSLALRNNPEIPVRTRERIRAAAEQLGYRPDPVLDAFNLHRLAHHPLRSAPAIAFVNDPTPGPSHADSAARLETFHGAKAAAEQLGFVLDRFLLGPGGMSAARLGRILAARNIDCVIAASLSTAISELPLDWSKRSGLKIESFHVNPAFDIFTSDHVQSGRLAVTRLRELGYARIGMVLSRAEDERLQQYPRSGYLVETARHPPASEIDLLYLDDATHAESGPELRRWIERNRLDAVVASSDRWLPELHHAGCSVPQDIGFAVLDRAGCGAAVAGVNADHFLVGKAAVELIAMRRRINQRDADETSITFIPVTWQDGPTAPDRRSRRPADLLEEHHRLPGARADATA